MGRNRKLKSFHAIIIGNVDRPTIYCRQWDEDLRSITECPSKKHKGFYTLQEAQEWMAEQGVDVYAIVKASDRKMPLAHHPPHPQDDEENALKYEHTMSTNSSHSPSLSTPKPSQGWAMASTPETQAETQAQPHRHHFDIVPPDTERSIRAPKAQVTITVDFEKINISGESS